MREPRTNRDPCEAGAKNGSRRHFPVGAAQLPSNEHRPAKLLGHPRPETKRSISRFLTKKARSDWAKTLAGKLVGNS